MSTAVPKCGPIAISRTTAFCALGGAGVAAAPSSRSSSQRLQRPTTSDPTLHGPSTRPSTVRIEASEAGPHATTAPTTAPDPDGPEGEGTRLSTVAKPSLCRCQGRSPPRWRRKHTQCLTGTCRLIEGAKGAPFRGTRHGDQWQSVSAVDGHGRGDGHAHGSREVHGKLGRSA